MIKTYKYRIYPNKKQTEKLVWILDICRQVYNCSLLDRIQEYKNNKTGLSRFTQQVILKNDKLKFKYLKEINAQVLQEVLLRVDKAYKNFFRRVKSGGTPGFPRFKNENRYDSITYPQKVQFDMLYNNKKLYLSKIGYIKIKLHRELPFYNTKTCTIKREINKWYACFSVELAPTPLENKPTKSIGIDMGIKSFITLSDGKFVRSPKCLKLSERKLIKKQKQLSYKKKGSCNKNKSRIILAKLHCKIKNQRKDFHHKLSRYLINNYGFIAVENLNIKGMVRNHKLAKSISDVGWGQFISFLIYKAEEAGTIVEKVNPQYTSVICSSCGERVPKTLADRFHKCPNCGIEIDRDLNAAINILSKSTVGITESNAWGETCQSAHSLNQETCIVR